MTVYEGFAYVRTELTSFESLYQSLTIGLVSALRRGLW